MKNSISFFKHSLVLAMAFIIGCSNSDSGGGKGPAPQDPNNPSKLTPEQRWPEAGDFRYHLKPSVNEQRCEAGPFNFPKKFEYCLALQDEQKNDDCAVALRAATYKNNCGDDFEPKNIPAFVSYGWDSRLNRNCTTANPKVQRIPSFKDHCDFLKKESAHEGCHWRARGEAFKKWKCSGDFSAAPVVTLPTPTPPPPPSPTPSPTPGPEPTPEDLRPQIVKDLAAAGIEVEVDHNVPHLPGEDFRMKLPLFWQALNTYKAELIARKNVISRIVVTIYSEFDSQRKELTLDVEIGNVLGQYLRALDRRLELERKLGLVLDFGIELTAPNDLPNFLQMLTDFEKLQIEIKKLSPMVEKIRLYSYTAFWMEDRRLELKKDNWKDDFLRLHPILQDMNWITNSLAPKQITYAGDPDFFQDLPRAARVVQDLKAEGKALLALARQSAIQQISLTPFTDQNSLHSRDGLLRVASQDPGLSQIRNSVKAFSQFVEACAELKVSHEINWESTDANTQEAVRRIESKMNLLRSKIGKVSEIEISSYTEFFPSQKKLVVSGTGPIEELNQAIAKIK